MSNWRTSTVHFKFKVNRLNLPPKTKYFNVNRLNFVTPPPPSPSIENFIFFYEFWTISLSRLFPRRFPASTYSSSFGQARSMGRTFGLFTPPCGKHSRGNLLCSGISELTRSPRSDWERPLGERTSRHDSLSYRVASSAHPPTAYYGVSLPLPSADERSV